MSVARSVLPDHILSAVLTLAQRELLRKDQSKTRLAFRSHDFLLQEIFFELQKTKKFEILNAFVFSDSAPDPYSPALNESVSRLQLAGLIGRENPDYEVVFLRPAADQFYDKVLTSEFTEKDIRELTEVASQFLQRIPRA